MRAISDSYVPFLMPGKVPQDQYMDFDPDEKPDSCGMWPITQCVRACLAKGI
jgi:hypothetical protein